jgi:S-DNA-T family DNA segregation ATPase FtsK/SpoIIIE
MSDRKPQKPDRGARRHEIQGLLFIMAGLLLALSLLTYRVDDPSWVTASPRSDPQNAAGRVGATLSEILFQLFGLIAHLFSPLLLMAGIRRLFWLERRRPPAKQTFFGCLLLLIGLCALAEFSGVEIHHVMGGGILGHAIFNLLRVYFATAGSLILVGLALLLGLLLAAPGWLRRRMTRSWEWAQAFWHRQHRVSVDDEEVRPTEEATPSEDLSEALSTAVGGPMLIPRVAVRSSIPSEPLEEGLPQSASRRNIGEYRLPPLSLLSDPTREAPTQEAWTERSRVLEQKLRDFDVIGRVTEIHPGPVVTMFEFEPAPGIKINRITTLADDLALAMKALHVRIIAPLPWKSTVGIEVPNAHREAVLLKETLASPVFSRLDSKLRLALGKDVFGNPVAVDLAGMPHLLIAGSTGSGKSVGLNDMILSLLFSATPAEVRMLMIDPKMLEFSLYDGIPHLMAPVVVRPKGASKALRKMVSEMQRRYELLAEKGVRNIDAYNLRIREEAEETPEAERPAPLPYIVIFIDELADLMMVAAKDVEDSITRLAQMARAAGIHLVLATQRPSVDVLTGLIKANFPARMAFRVSSKTDSRTILDANGAEQLLGKGDMLYLASGAGHLTRVHCAYVSEAEVKKVTSFIKEQVQPHYEAEFTEAALAVEEAEVPSDAAADERDALYEQARELVVTTGQASASFIQRRLRVGYPRAARMIEMMEEDGVVGPAVGAKPREILIKPSELNKQETR